MRLESVRHAWSHSVRGPMRTAHETWDRVVPSTRIDAFAAQPGCDSGLFNI